jgi:hypothetical protein
VIEASLFRHVNRRAGGVETQAKPLSLDFIASKAYPLQKVNAEFLMAWG